jgi:hypothetical protein
VRQSQAGSVLCQEFDQPRVVCKHIDGPGFDLGKHTTMEALGRERCLRMLSNTLTLNNEIAFRFSMDSVPARGARGACGRCAVNATL